MEEGTKKQTESRYNMNEANFLLLGELQREAFRLMTKKKYNSSMDIWQSIRSIVESVFTETEQDSLNNIEKEFKSTLRFNVPEGLSDYKPMCELSERAKFIRGVFQRHKLKHLRIYIRQLLSLMRNYKISMTDLDKKKALS